MDFWYILFCMNLIKEKQNVWCIYNCVRGITEYILWQEGISILTGHPWEINWRSDDGRIFHRLASGSIHFTLCFSSTTCQCWALTRSYFNMASGLHLHVMIMGESAWWVLVGRSIIARMASNTQKWLYTEVTINYINISTKSNKCIFNSTSP